MAQQIGIDSALLDGQAETRGQNIFNCIQRSLGFSFLFSIGLGPGRESGSVEIVDSPGICHPESLCFWQGEGSAFRLSVAIFPGSQQSQEKSKSLRVEELKSARVDRKGKDLTQRGQRRAGPCGVRRFTLSLEGLVYPVYPELRREPRRAAAFPSFAILFYDGKVWVNR
jgi:hypothetical protein